MVALSVLKHPELSTTETGLQLDLLQGRLCIIGLVKELERFGTGREQKNATISKKQNNPSDARHPSCRCGLGLNRRPLFFELTNSAKSA